MSEGKGKKRQPKQKKGLFDDLEGLTDSEIDEKMAALKASVEASLKEQKRVKQERDAEIMLVQSLRSIQESARGFSKERNTLLNEFRKIRENAKKVKADRDEINRAVSQGRKHSDIGVTTQTEDMLCIAPLQIIDDVFCDCFVRNHSAIHHAISCP